MKLNLTKLFYGSNVLSSSNRLPVALDSFASVVANTAVSVGNSSTAVLSSNSSRKYAVFTNDSDETIYLALGGTATSNSGIRLNSGGGSYEINLTNLYTGAVTAICTSGSKNLCVVEG